MKVPSTLPEADWNKIVETVKNNDAFSDIKLVVNDYTEKKELNLLFTDSKNNGIVVFKGTGTHEWHDNAAGGQWDVVDTEQQENANKFIRELK